MKWSVVGVLLVVSASGCGSDGENGGPDAPPADAAVPADASFPIDRGTDATRDAALADAASPLDANLPSDGSIDCNMVFQGSFTIQNPADVVTISPYCEITGDLIVNAPGLMSIALPSLVKIDGNLSWPGAPDLTTLDLGALESVKQVGVKNVAPKLTTLLLPKLQTADLFDVNGSAQATQVATLDLSSLVSTPQLLLNLVGDVALPAFTDGPLFINTAGSVSAPLLVHGGALIQAKTVSFDQLTTADGGLTLQLTGGPLDLPKLTSAQQLLILCPGVVTVPLLASVTMDARFFVQDLGAPLLTTVGGKLFIATSAAAIHLPALKSVVSLDLSWDANGVMCTQASPALTVIDIPLVDLQTFNVGLCPKLPQCRIDAFAQQLVQQHQWGGAPVEHCGQQPNMPCP
jgi:hypothetical protein